MKGEKIGKKTQSFPSKEGQLFSLGHIATQTGNTAYGIYA